MTKLLPNMTKPTTTANMTKALNSTELDLSKVPEYFLRTVVDHVKYLQSERIREDEMRAMQNGGRVPTNFHGSDYSEPMLKPVVWNTYSIFLVQYGMLALFSVCSNLLVIAYIMRFKLYRDVTQAFLVNLSLCYFMQSLVVLPLTLAVLLIQNWIFGQFLCFFLPMLQVSELLFDTTDASGSFHGKTAGKMAKRNHGSEISKFGSSRCQISME
jgi:hypothetical protein